MKSICIRNSFTRNISRKLLPESDNVWSHRWEFMTSQEVVDIVATHQGGGGTPPDPRSAINELIHESNRRWRLEEPVIDDTTIVVAFFR